MSKLPTIHKGQFRKKSQKGGQMEVKVEAEHVAKIPNLRNFATCKISAVAQIPSVCGSSFLPTSDAHLRVRLGFFVFKSAR